MKCVLGYVHKARHHRLGPNRQGVGADLQDPDEQAGVTGALNRATKDEDGRGLRDRGDDAAEHENDEGEDENPFLGEEGERSSEEGLEADSREQEGAAVPAYVLQGAKVVRDGRRTGRDDGVVETGKDFDEQESDQQEEQLDPGRRRVAVHRGLRVLWSRVRGPELAVFVEDLADTDAAGAQVLLVPQDGSPLIALVFWFV